jgi:putative flippase GtrA
LSAASNDRPVKSAVSVRLARFLFAHKFSRFLLVGGLSTALLYVVLIGMVEGLGLSPTLSSTVGYLISSLLNYVLNYSFTYRSAAPHGRSLPRFALIVACGLILNGTVAYVGTTVLGVHYLLAQAAATAATLLWNFWANLRWTF